MFKTRKRMLSFRLSEDEYERLKEISLAERARSVSEFARAALCNIPEGKGAAAGSAAPRVEELEGAVKQLKQEMHQLRQLVEAIGMPPPKPETASLEENSQ